MSKLIVNELPNWYFCISLLRYGRSDLYTWIWKRTRRQSLPRSGCIASPYIYPIPRQAGMRRYSLSSTCLALNSRIIIQIALAPIISIRLWDLPLSLKDYWWSDRLGVSRTLHTPYFCITILGNFLRKNRHFWGGIGLSEARTSDLFPLRGIMHHWSKRNLVNSVIPPVLWPQVTTPRGVRGPGIEGRKREENER